MAEEEEEAKHTNPHDIIGVKGIPKAFKGALSHLKLQQRMENERYLLAHPELQMLTSLFMRHVLDEHPENVLEFAGRFFDRHDLKEWLDWVMGSHESPA
mmetsp:Transcript_21026/g.38928  ORF Transcript_21026/g.38928 Transcript_21026/m.38928 type:complete len:99 (-) Transcript_21026:78-374(-)